jgi:hypothetical protein
MALSLESRLGVKVRSDDGRDNQGRSDRWTRARGPVISIASFAAMFSACDPRDSSVGAQLRHSEWDWLLPGANHMAKIGLDYIVLNL